MKSFWTTVLAVSCLSSVSLGAPARLVNTMTWDIHTEAYWTKAQNWLLEKGLASVYYNYGNNGVACDTPDIRLKNFKDYVPADTRFLAMSGHGYLDSLHFYMPEFYASYDAAFGAAVDYETWSDYDYEFVDAFDSGGTALHGFAASTQGIARYLRPSALPAGAIVYGGYCGSLNDAAGWQCSQGVQSYSGYLGEPDYETVFWNLGRFVYRLTCHADSTAGVSRPIRLPAARDAVSGGAVPLLRLADLTCIDTSDIMLSASKSGCAILDVSLDLLGIDEDRQVYLGVAPRSSDARYLLRRGAMVDTMVCTPVAKYDRFGRDVLEATLPAIVDTFEIVESAYGSFFASTGIWATADVPPCAPDSLYDAVDLFSDPLSTAQAAAIDDSLSYLLESEAGYNAVVAARWESFAAPVVADLEEQGKSVFKIVNPFLSPEMVTYYYRRVVEQNQRVGGDWPTAPGPTLYLSGSAMLVRYAVAPGDASECGGACYSDLAMTDIDGDWLPNGPVTRIPGYTPEEIEAVLQAAAEYRAGTSVNPQRRVAFWCDDQDYQWVLNMRRVAELYDGIGYSDGAVVKLSQVPGSSAARFAKFCDIVNGGIAELWSFGYSSDYMWGSAFKLSPYGPIRAEDFDQLTTEQVFIAWAPTCQTASTNELMGSQSIAGALMLPGAGSASRLAGFVGRVSAGGDIAQWLIAEALAAARCEAAPGIDSVADVVYRGVLDFAAEYPMFRDIALGTSVLGGNVVLQGVDPSAAAVLAGAPETALSLSSIASGSSTEFQYSRSGSGMVYGMLTVYDVRGRLVRRIDAGELAATGSIVWDGRDVSGRTIASGVYLGLLEVRGAAGTLRGVSKATIVR